MDWLGACGAQRAASSRDAARALTSPPLPLPLPLSQAVAISLLAFGLLIDALFSNAADFVFEPDLKNSARGQARRS